VASVHDKTESHCGVEHDSPKLLLLSNITELGIAIGKDIGWKSKKSACRPVNEECPICSSKTFKVKNSLFLPLS